MAAFSLWPGGGNTLRRVSRAGRLAESVKCLLFKHGDLTSHYRTHIKKWDVVAHTCINSRRGREGRVLQPAGQPAELTPMKDFVSKTKMDVT